jgi:hypothetical protein
MDCVNHSGVTAAAYCQTCGKPLCAGCVRTAAGGQILCEPCWTGWQVYQQPFAAPSGSPNPSAAAVLGLIPGVGAMYNGQFFKGLIHVVVFAVLVSMAHHYGIFGIFIAAWVLYQSFEAYHTAIALRDGQPPPDPLGLNEVGNWLNLGMHNRYPGQPGVQPGPQPWSQPAPGPAPTQGQASSAQPGYEQVYTGPSQPPYQQGYYQPPGAPPAPGSTDPGYTPDPSAYWRPLFMRRKEPVGAVILIALGLLFLLNQLDIFHTDLIKFTWPFFLIGLGVWLIVRRISETKGGSK